MIGYWIQPCPLLGSHVAIGFDNLFLFSYLLLYSHLFSKILPIILFKLATHYSFIPIPIILDYSSINFNGRIWPE